MKPTVILAVLLNCSHLWAAPEVTFKRQQLHGDFYSEGAAIGDINGDGKPDVVAGPFWWEGPTFEKQHAYYEPKIFSINGYSDNFFAYVHDMTGDGRNDILILGFPGKEARLYVNPGVHDDKPWPMHIVADVVDNESPVFTDITGDGKPEIVCSTGGSFGWFEPNYENPTEKWPFVGVTEDMKVAKFTHGLGVGDVNGDGKLDLLEARRWWENNGSTKWTQHNFAAGVGGGAQMFAYDFDGNGTNDVFTSLAAHRYGVAVYLQNNPAPNQPTWKQVMLASEQPQDNDYGIVFSQPHAAYLADINGDGVKDIVTGKRYWAHNGHDPDERGHRVIYWYETKRDGKGGVEFVPHLVDSESGVGVDVQVGDVNGDGLPDIVVGNKGGVFILTQERKESTAAVAPVKLYGPGLKSQQDYAHGQSPAEALKSLQLPSGFKAELIAAEPDLVQPIAFTFDERGRIWVIEGNSYPKPRETGSGQDRILILEDKDGDGTFETRKVFCEGINLASGIELGFGGVWVGAAPYLMFIPDLDHDDRADALNGTHASNENFKVYASYPQVPGVNFTAYALLDGWGSQDTHETLNSFIWGPDGWLYGCHGVFTHSQVGKPGTPNDQRTAINAGVWRYHPVRHEFEVFAEGTSNPWGLDYDQYGEFFVTACVIPHLYHIVPGGRYQRQAGPHLNPYTYDDIKTIADHAHYAGNPRPDVTFDKATGAGVMNEDTNALGGGHAHCGLAIYQSSLFPPTYRNQFIFGNLHGHRLVTDYTDVHGSTYIGKHGADFMRSNDMNFIPVTQKVGPDGALYVSDWSDKQVCHRGSNAVENWDRSNGRIYRVTYAGPPPTSDLSDKSDLPKAPFDLAKESDENLARLAVQTGNEWFSRMARRVLMERAIDRELDVPSLKAPGAKQTPKWVWATHCIERTRNPNATSHIINLRNTDENARRWGIRVCGESDEANSIQQQGDSTNHWSLLLSKGSLVELAKTEPASSVRRELASLLQRIPQDQRQPLATALLSHGEDAEDPMIPLLIWYGIEPVVGADPKAGLEFARVSKMPKVTEFIYRRLSSDDAGRASVLAALMNEPDAAKREATLAMILTSARGAGKLVMPPDWANISAKLGSSPSVQELSALFGDPGALKSFRDQLGLATASVADRDHALAVLLQTGDPETAKILQQLLTQSAPTSLRRKAIQALASLRDAGTPALLSSLLPKLSTNELPDAVNTLASTREGAKALLKAVEAKTVPATALSPFLVRQLSAFDDVEINALIKAAWGDVNAPKADLAERTQKYRALLTSAALSKGDLAKGKALFTAICGQCHKLFGQGQDVGPDITGSNRADLNYLLENVLDPNAVIGKAYQLNVFTMKDGRILSGVIKDEGPAAVKIAMMGGIEFILPMGDIAKREVSKLSTMPEGLFDALQQEQVVDLVKYLQSGGGSGTAAAKVEGALEGESLTFKASAGNARVQGMANFKAGQWSGGSHLWWTGAKPGAKLTIAFKATKSGKQKVSAVFTKAPDYGIVSITLDGKPTAIAEYDLYDPQVIPTGLESLGEFDLTAGDHSLEVTITGSNANARPSHMFALDYLKLE